MNRKIWKYTALLLAAALIGAAGFFIGRSVTDSKYQAEKELNVKINRSDLESLGKIEGPIYVTGHKSPDSDTVGSAIGYAALLRELGYDARPVVLGNINNETRYVLESGGIEVPMLLEDASGCTVVLVDHSEYTQSAEGLRDANVISIVDHHGDGSVTTGNLLIYDARPLGSTATIVWIRYRNYGIVPDRQAAYAMTGSILSDTRNLKSDAATFADREALKDLSKLAGIEDTDAMYQKMYQESLSYTGMSDEEIFLSDYKEYKSGSKKYGIGVISAYDEEAGKDLAARMMDILPSIRPSTGMDLLFAQISIFNDELGLDITYIVPSDETAAEVIETGLGEKAVLTGNYYRIEPGLSRKRVLVPAITDVLESYPGE